MSSAVLYGIWEFGIGRYRTTITYLLNGVFRHDLMLDKNDGLPGLLGGTFNLIATILALKAFARGKMGVVTGVAAASILVPLGYSYLMGEELSRLYFIGIGVTVAGLIAFYVPNMKVKPDETNSLIAIVLAGGAALFWGLATVVTDIGSRVNGAGSMLMSMMPQILFTFVVVAVLGFKGSAHRSVRHPRPDGLTEGKAHDRSPDRVPEGPCPAPAGRGDEPAGRRQGGRVQPFGHRRRAPWRFNTYAALTMTFNTAAY